MINQFHPIDTKYLSTDFLIDGRRSTIGGLRLGVELVSKELNHLAAILHVYAGGLNFMK